MKSAILQIFLIPFPVNNSVNAIANGTIATYWNPLRYLSSGVAAEDGNNDLMVLFMMLPSLLPVRWQDYRRSPVKPPLDRETC